MSSTFSPVVHHMTKLAGQQGYRITAVTPLTRLSNLGEVVLLQHGQFWDAGGNALKTLPAWAYAEMRKMSPAALKEVGFAEAPEQPKDAPNFLDPETVESKRADLEERRSAARVRGKH